MVRKFLLQKIYSEVLGAEVLHETAMDLLSVLEFQHWLHPSNEYDVRTATVEELQNFTPNELEQVYPIGSIDFVESVINRAFPAADHMSPLCIPGSLMEPQFLCRKVGIVKNMDEAAALGREWGNDLLFVKSADHLKTDLTGVYPVSALPETNEASIFVSQPLSLEENSSEWRVFVCNGKILDTRCYLGDPWITPDRNLIALACSRLNTVEKLKAYTLDVFVDDHGRTGVLEVHNFVSCGLYGSQNIPVAAWILGYQKALEDLGVLRSYYLKS